MRLLRLRQAVGAVELIDARSGDARVKGYVRQGFDLNEGMILVHEGTVYHGADAVSALALLSSPSTLFNAANRLFLSSRWSARLLYPLLRFGRNMTLKARGIAQIEL